MKRELPLSHWQSFSGDPAVVISATILKFVIPEQAGIHLSGVGNGFPAFAGVTEPKEKFASQTSRCSFSYLFVKAIRRASQQPL